MDRDQLSRPRHGFDRSNDRSFDRVYNDRNGDRSTTRTSGRPDRRDGRDDRDVKDGDGRENRFGQRDNFKENYQERYRETNRELIKYIYSTLDVSTLKFDILRYEQQLSKFISGVYFLSPNYSGRNSFLVFTKLKSKYFSFMIDRRQLSYTFDKVDIDKVFVNHCNVDVDLDIYSGTILDGVYVRKGNAHEFIVTDVYVFKGTDYTHNQLDHKLFELEMYLDNINSQIRFVKDRINAKINLDLKVNKVVKATEIKSFLAKDFVEIEKNYQVRGVCFYPEMSGTKLLCLPKHDGDERFDGQNVRDYKDVKDTKDGTGSRKAVKNGSDDGSDTESEESGGSAKPKAREGLQKSKNIVKRVFVSKTDEPVYAVLKMESTKTADNYKLFALEKVKVGTTERFKKCQMDIAYIPNMKKSQWCRDITTASPDGSVFVKCIWRNDKRKWEPMEQKLDVKLPSLIDDIRKDIVEMEQSDSDSDEE